MHGRPIGVKKKKVIKIIKIRLLNEMLKITNKFIYMGNYSK